MAPLNKRKFCQSDQLGAAMVFAQSFALSLAPFAQTRAQQTHLKKLR